jgi:hypothetical protein
MLWWLIGIAVVLLLLAVVVARLRRPRRPAPKRPPARPGAVGPRPGEIWWADVPYEDGSGHKVRPCLVLRTRRDAVEVLKITSQDQSHRRDHVEISTRNWDRNADHNSFLDLTDPIPVRLASFEDKAGDLDAATWQKVRRLHSIR